VRFPRATHLVILLKSKRSAHRVMERITRYLEETQEVSASHYQCGSPRVAGPEGIGGNEELAVGRSKRGVEGAQHRLVSKPGIGVPAGVFGGIDQLTWRSTLVVDRRAAYLAGTSRSVGSCALKVHRRQQLGRAALVKPSRQPITECCVCGGDTGLWHCGHLRRC
jgi:hypothetical protein